MNNEYTDRALAWDDEIENDDAYQILPEGDYTFTVAKFERARHKGSDKIPPCNKAVLTLSVSDGKHSGNVLVNLLLDKTLEWKLCQFFTSIGQRKRGERLRMNWQQVTGSTGHCKIGTRQWTGNDGKEREGNEVLEFYEPATDEATGFIELPGPTPTPWDSKF